MAQQQQQQLAGEPAAAPAPVVQAKPGPGVQALEALLQTGRPEPTQVVALVDTYRGERDALFALLHTSLGNEFVQQVVQEMGGVRASIDRKELAAGDPSNPTGGYFLASAQEQGARWRTADGDFTGKADKSGLDTTYKLDEDDALHGKVSAKGEGTLAWERDGKSQGELYGGKGAFGVRRDWGLDSGTLTTGLEHRGAFTGAYGRYASTDGKISTDGRAGVAHGGVAGSLSGTYKPSDSDTYTGSLAHDPTATSLALSGSHKSGTDAYTGAADLKHTAAGITGSLGAGWTNGKTALDGKYTHGLTSDKLHLGGSHKSGADTYTGAMDLDHSAAGTTGSLGAGWTNGTSALDAKYTHGLAADQFHHRGSPKVSDELSMTGALDHERTRAGGSQTTLALAEKYRSDKMVQSLSLDAGAGDRTYLGVTGSTDMQIGKGLYAGAWGSFRQEEGKQTTAQLGASLTFTPHEKAALTLAGVLDQNGAIETRLQLDIFKSKIAGVGTIADHKKDALVSLFLSYSQAGRNGVMPGGMMDQRYGAPSMDFGRGAGEGQFTAGIKISF